MFFTKLIINSPDMTEGINLNFKKDLNFVSGKNWSGKSFAAKVLIESALNYFSADPAVNFRTEGNAAVEVCFSTRFGEEVQTKKNGGEWENRILKKSGRGVFPDDAIRRLVSGFIMSASIFPNLRGAYPFMISSETLEDIFCGGSTAWPEIKKIITCGESGPGEMFNTCESDLNAEIKHTADEIFMTRLKMKQPEKIIKEKNLLAGEIRVLEKRKRILIKKISALEDIRADLIRLDLLRERFNKISLLVEEEKENRVLINNIESELGRFAMHREQGKSADIPGLNELQESFFKIRNLQDEIDRIIKYKEKISDSVWKAAVVINISAAVILGLILWGRVSPSLYPGGILLTAAAVLVINPVLYLFRRISWKQTPLSGMERERDELITSIYDNLYKKESSGNVASLGEIYEFLLKYFEEYVDYSEKKDELNRLNKKSKSPGVLKKILEELDSIKNDEKKIKENIRVLTGAAGADVKDDLTLKMTDALLEESNAGLDAISRTANLKKGVLKGIEESISPGGTADYEHDVSQREKEINGLQSRLKLFRERKEHFLLLQQLMSRSVKSLTEKGVSSLSESALNLFMRFGRNNYRDRINEETVRNYITGSADEADWSPAARHYLELAVIVSLSDFLPDCGFSVPLIIDDPFLFMDDDMIKNVLAIFSVMSLKRQVIVFANTGKFFEGEIQEIKGSWIKTDN